MEVMADYHEAFNYHYQVRSEIAVSPPETGQAIRLLKINYIK
jgi:hypothetical protein